MQPNRPATRLSTLRANLVRAALLAVGSALLVLASAAPAAAATWSAHGRVMFSDGSVGAFATVTMSTPSGWSQSVQADANGDYAISLNDSSGASSVTLRATRGTCQSPTQNVYDEDITMTLTIGGSSSGC